jgi:PAS domain S-box-containing protein
MPTSLDLAGRLSAVVQLQQEILAVATHVDRVLQCVISRVPQLTNGSGAGIALLDGDALLVTAVSGPAAGDIGRRVPLDRSLSGESLKKRTLLRSDDTDEDLRVDSVATRAAGMRSIIVAPLFDGDNPAGVLQTYSVRPNAFDDLDAYTLQLLAGMTSSAAMVARELQQRKASEERYRMLFERNVAGVFRTTEDGRILDCNDAFVEALGYTSRSDLLAQETWDLYEQRADRDAFLEMLRSKQTLKNVRIRLKKMNGNPMTAMVTVSILPGEGANFQLLGTLVEA